MRVGWCVTEDYSERIFPAGLQLVLLHDKKNPITEYNVQFQEEIQKIKVHFDTFLML